MAQEKEQLYYPLFDYLRFALASVVMLGHDNLLPWAHSAKLAVDVFFALSGWLIGNILLKTEVRELPKFYFNRAVRIWIPYFIALTLVIIASLLKDPIDAKWYEFIVYKITWVYNLFGIPQLETCRSCMPLDSTANHFWSVNAEEQFYLLAPIFLVVFAKYGRSALLWGLLIVSLWLLTMYAPIALGVLAAILHSRFPHFHRRTDVRAFLFIIFVGCCAGLYSGNYYTVYAPILAISAVLLLAVEGKKHDIGVFLGGMSYPLYLNHWIGVFFFNLALEPFGLRDSGWRNLLSAIMNYAIAAFLYGLVERRVLSLRGKYYTAKRGLIFTVLAYISVIIGLAFGGLLTESTHILAVFVIFFVGAAIVLFSVTTGSRSKEKSTQGLSSATST